jgi:phosphatidylglycerophosphatase A
MKKISFWHPASLVSTLFGIGKSPYMPGTLGSVVALVDFYFALRFGFTFVFIVPLIIGWFFISLWCAKIYLCGSKEDKQEIISDEFVGQYIAIIISYLLIGLFAPEAIMAKGVYQYNYLIILSSFALFRLFDIVKPSFIGKADRNIKGAFGVMFDDVLAGVMAGLFNVLGFYVLIKFII